jgi:hypothetical protein
VSIDGRFALYEINYLTLELWEVATSCYLHTFTRQIGSVELLYLSNNSDLAATLPWVEVNLLRCLLCCHVDGHFALSGSNDNTLKLWSVATGECLRTFTGHKDSVTSACLSADGLFVLSGSNDNTLKLWSVATGECLRTFTGHKDSVTSACLSADGRFALSGSNDNTLKLWSVATGECLRTFTGHKDSVTSACLSADGRFALSGSNDNTLILWNLDWELKNRLPADWDEGVRPYLENFLVLHTSYAASPPASGLLTWTEEDFQNLLYTLGCGGYGWLRPEAIKQHLEAMLKAMAAKKTQQQAIEKLSRFYWLITMIPAALNLNFWVVLSVGLLPACLLTCFWVLRFFSSTLANKRSPIVYHRNFSQQKTAHILTARKNKQLPTKSIFNGLGFLVFYIVLPLKLRLSITLVLSLTLALPLTWWVLFFLRR